MTDFNSEGPGSSWVEVLAPDGRVFYHSASENISSWEKPDVLKSVTEKVVDSTDWREYRIWDGRSFYHNPKTGLSVWAPPPEVERRYRELTGEDLEGLPMEISTPEGESSSVFAADARTEIVRLLAELFPVIDPPPKAGEILEALNTQETFNTARFRDSRLRKLATIDFLLYCERKAMQKFRDGERVLARAMVEGLKQLDSKIEPSSSYESIIAWGERQPWWTRINEVRRRELFEAFVADVARCRARDEAQRDAVFMQQLKSAIVNDPTVDYAADFDTVVRQKFQALPAWETLGEAQRVGVWRSCVAQHIRNVRAAISAGEALSQGDRARRKAKDFVRAHLRCLFDSGTFTDFNGVISSLETCAAATPGEVELAALPVEQLQHLVQSAFRDVAAGKAPFADHPQPALPE